MNIENILKGLELLAKKLNKHNIRWALGASLLLYIEGFDTTVDDIDIIVHRDDLKTLLYLLDDYNYVYQEPNKIYKTKHFFSLKSNDVDVDIMVDFIVKTDSILYVYPFHIAKKIKMKNTTVYLSKVSEWLRAYKAMNRTDKVLLINEKRLRKN